MQSHALKQQKREEEPGLIPLQKTSGSVSTCGDVRCDRKGNDTGTDVRIPADLIGIGVMSIVLRHPPAKADSGQYIPHDQSHQPIGTMGTEDLLVTGIMPDKGHLGEQHPEQDSDPERGPRIADNEERDPACDEYRTGQADLHAVVPRPAIQQPGLAHLLGEHQIIVRCTVYRRYGHDFTSAEWGRAMGAEVGRGRQPSAETGHGIVSG